VDDMMQKGQQAAAQSSTQTAENKEPRRIEIIEDEDEEDRPSNEQPENVDRLRQQVDALKDELHRLQNE